MRVAGQDELFSTRSILLLLIPLFLEQLLGVTVGFADTIMVASVGEQAVSAVSLVDSVNMLIIQIFSALATGGSVVVAQYIGRRDQANANTAARQLVFSTFSISLLMMGLCLILCRGILGLLFPSVEPLIMENAVTYFILSAISYPFLSVYNAGAALLRSVGDSKTPLIIAVAINLINVIGNAITIYGLGWGVAGAASASLLARAVGAVIIIALLAKAGSSRITLYPLYKIDFRFDMIKRILQIGIPNGIEGGIFQVGKLMVSNLVSTFGTMAIAANAISNTISGIANVPGTAISLCMVTVVGQCMGAGKADQAERNVKKLMKIAHLAMFTTSALVLIFLQPLLRAFGLTAESMALAEQVMILFTLASFIFWPIAFALPNALRAAGDAKVTMFISIGSMWVFRIGFSYLLTGVFGMGLMGVWTAMVIDWVVRGGLFLYRFRKGKWRELRVI